MSNFIVDLTLNRGIKQQWIVRKGSLADSRVGHGTDRDAFMTMTTLCHCRACPDNLQKKNAPFISIISMNDAPSMVVSEHQNKHALTPIEKVKTYFFASSPPTSDGMNHI